MLNFGKLLKLNLSLLLLLALLFFFPENLATKNSQPNDVFINGYLSKIEANKALSLSKNLNKDNIIVAVIDQGVDQNHPDLKGKIWQNKDEIPNNYIDDDGNGYVDDTSGYNFLYDSDMIKPLGGHGTLISGVIAANRNNKKGVSGLTKKTKIMPLTSCSSYRCDNSAVQEAIKYAADNGADVINLSLSGPSISVQNNKNYQEAVNYAREKGVIIIVASGNGYVSTGEGKNLDIYKNSPVCEVGSKEVIGVTSLNYKLQKSTFADYGSDCIDIAAPGEDIISTVPPHFSRFGIPYDLTQGTSFSAGIVSGVVAHLKSISPHLTQSEIIKILQNTSKKINYQNYKYIGELGGGSVNMFGATKKIIRNNY
jgi:subtilisin family serine protease